MKYQPLLGTLTMLLVFVSGSGHREGSPTNFEVFNNQVDSLSSAVAGVLVGEHGNVVSLKTGPRTVDEFVRQRLLERLLEDKLVVREDSASATEVRINVPVIEVNYSAPVSSHIFGASDVVRSIRSEYDVDISDSGRVTFAKSFRMAYSDTVSMSDIPQLEAGSYNFLHGRVDSRNFLDTVLQPVLFVASAAVIVYLFFTLRGS